ncbi:MAG: hypothetical protein INH41_31780, partial [Myxococcaceae bacterium]|nr:hypothetical protein [Myxococcaceae bacterium]
ELERALRFGRRAERLFGRPQLAPASLPMSLDELDELIAGWPEGVAAVEALWARLVRIDLGGSLVRWLRKRARRALTAPPRTGPELLLFAEFWRQVAVARMDAFLEARVGLVAWREGERFPLLRWLWHRERALPSSLSLRSEPREALFEVAAVLSELPSSAERAPLVMAGLIPVARQADRLRETEAWARVRDELRVLARVVWASRGRRPPGAQDTLEGLVRALRDSG